METPSPRNPWRPPQQKSRLAALQLVLLSLPQISLVSGVNPSLTLVNRMRLRSFYSDSEAQAAALPVFLVLSHIVAALSTVLSSG